MIHASLVCQGCSGTLYAVSTSHTHLAPLLSWEVDDDHTPACCPLRSFLPLTGKATHIHALPHAERVLTVPD
ncbi:hypothetical protein AB0D46_14340 [Streptomyces sp. NPDC048383]|uniref:hypothetical protein n=1 Tax=Streptomyces sp. NPDC048383 TaxID=3155386 RepID=UPI00341CB534